MKLLRMKDLNRQYGLPRSTVNYWRSKGQFPQPLKIGPSTIAWRASDIDTWLDSCDRAAPLKVRKAQ